MGHGRNSKKEPDLKKGPENAPGRAKDLGKSPEVGMSLEKRPGQQTCRVGTHTPPFSLNGHFLICEMGSTIPAEYRDGHRVLIPGPKWSWNTGRCLIALITGPLAVSRSSPNQAPTRHMGLPHRLIGYGRVSGLVQGCRTVCRASPPALPLPCRAGDWSHRWQRVWSQAHSRCSECVRHRSCLGCSPMMSFHIPQAFLTKLPSSAKKSHFPASQILKPDGSGSPLNSWNQKATLPSKPRSSIRASILGPSHLEAEQEEAKVKVRSRT